MQRRAGGPVVAIAAALSLLTSACATQGLAFRVDKRLTIDAPEARSTVTLPVTIRWHVRDFQAVAPGSGAAGTSSGYFAVFVDQAPQPPGKRLAWLARKDRTCRTSDGCPDAQYFAARNIYTTSDTQIRFDQLPRPASDNQKERHTVTIILLDPDGRRIGESAFFVDFSVSRKTDQ